MRRSIIVANAATIGLTSALLSCSASSTRENTATVALPLAGYDTLPDDSAIRIRTPSDVTTRRQQMIQYIWGSLGFPSTQVPTVVKNVASPVGVSNLARVDELDVSMTGSINADGGTSNLTLTTFGYHFIPQQFVKNRVVILHQGHACTFSDDATYSDNGYGMTRTINSLLAEGYSVVALYMINETSRACAGNPATVPSHSDLFQSYGKSMTTGSFLRFFLEPTVLVLNYLQTRYATGNFPQYTDFSMVGFSGGGWTTTMYAAVDPRITLSIPVAGSQPLYMINANDQGDLEQTCLLNFCSPQGTAQTPLNFYQVVAGYPELYVMGAYGSGRKQVQVLNRGDNHDFGQTQYDPTVNPKLTNLNYDQALHAYEVAVRNVLAGLGGGYFRLEIDESAQQHQISWATVINVILSELNGGRRYIGAVSSTDAVVRQMNGDLWHHGSAGWQDTSISIVGVPAVVQGAVAPFDVFYRDPSSDHLARATINGSTFGSQSMPGGVVGTDPVAASWGSGRFDVAALGGDYHVYHWWWNGSAVQTEQVGTGVGRGQPTLLATAPGRLDLFVRNFGSGVDHYQSTGSAPWSQETVGGGITDFPSAVATPGPTLHVYVRGFEVDPTLRTTEVGG